jgi:hypothetical protein
MLKKEDINFLINSISYFRDYRQENLKVFTNFYQRLDGFLGNTTQDQKLPGSSTYFFIKLRTTFLVVLRQVLNLPYYIIQAIALRRSQCRQIKSCQAFGIASSRLDLDVREGIAPQLERMTKAIGGGDVLNLFSKHCKEQKTIILYDPQLESGFWRMNPTSHNEKLFIFDGAFIIFFSLMLSVTGIFFRGAEELMFLRRYTKQSKAIKDGHDIPLYIRIIEALTFITFHSLTKRLPKHSTSLLTSNSFFVELLRVYILQNKDDGKIVELLHGIIADPTEAWFKRLLSFQDKIGEKNHFLIPQVPNLPELATLNNKYFLGNNVSINTYLNSFLHKNKKYYGSYKAYALNQLEQLSLNPDDKRLTLTVYGGTSIEGSFFHSSAFEVEVEVLNKTISYFLKNKIDINIIYVPHPSNKILPRRVVDIFNKLCVQVLDHSVFTYFITDYCISNISSCIFELNWLGAECFTPIIEVDGFYSKEYLETVHHPADDGMAAFENALYECLRVGLDSGNRSYVEKFDMRLKMIKGSNLS